jgi:choline-sulfatase
VAFSEYHAVASRAGWYMLRDGRFKYIHYVGHRPQLFDLVADPLECHDLAEGGDYGTVIAQLEGKLREIVDPDEVDARAKADQRRLIDRYGGRDAVLARGTFVNSPTPGETPKFVDGAGGQSQ